MARTLPTVRSWLRVTFNYRPRDPVELIYYSEVASDFDTFVRYTDREVDDDTYEAVPSMVVKFPPMTGALNEELLQIELPLNAFTTALSGSDQFPKPIGCLVEEYDTDGLVCVLYSGWVHQALKNQGGRRNRVRLDCRNFKSNFQVPMGIEALPQCAWTFTGKGCDLTTQDMIDLNFLMEGVVSSVTDKSAVIVLEAAKIDPILLDTVENNNFNKLFLRGFLVLNGIRIEIRDWNRTPLGGTVHQNFELVRAVPASWVGETILVHPGCEKTPRACHEQYANLRRWAGGGFLIPAYNPLIEQP